MGIEPTHQLVTGALVLKGIKYRNRHALKARAIPCNPFIVNGFPVFPASAEIGEKRSHPERHRHKIVIKKVPAPKWIIVKRACASPARWAETVS